MFKRKKYNSNQRKFRLSSLFISGNVPYPEYSEDPVGFIQNILGYELTDTQKMLAESVRDNPVTNAQSGHGIGKTFISACLALWYVYACGGQVVTTAPTRNQVVNLLWKEIRKIYALHKNKLGGECLETKLKLNPTAFAYGFSSSNYSADSFQGVHADRLLLIMDEANGCAALVDEGFQACATGDNNRILRIGNATVPFTPFHRHCMQGSVVLSAFDHVNVSWAYDIPDGETYPKLLPEIARLILDKKGRVLPQSEWPDELPRDRIPGAISIGWIEAVRTRYGEDSNYWLGRVCGIFPVNSIDGLFSYQRTAEMRERSKRMKPLLDSLNRNSPYTLGADCGDGGDHSAIAILRGRELIHVEAIITQGDGLDGNRLSDRIKELSEEYGGFQSIAYDATGVGSWLQTSLEKWYTGITYRVKWGEAANDNKYLRLKAEQYDLLAQAIKNKEANIFFNCSQEAFDELIKQMSAITYKTTVAEKMEIISKSDLRKVLGRSPDLLDAVVMAYSVPLGVVKGGTTGQVSDALSVLSMSV
jgi:hypothetical protein